jgi:hypothetical protein
MKHAIIVRAKFEDDKLFKNYLDVARQTFFPSINYQTDKNFTLFLIMESRHRPLINLIVNPHINLIFLDSMDHGKEYFSKNFYEIQTRHDFDDWMKKDYVQKIRAEWYAHRIQDIQTNLSQCIYLFVKKQIKITYMNIITTK